jgi:hypothetical protein
LNEQVLYVGMQKRAEAAQLPTSSHQSFGEPARTTRYCAQTVIAHNSIQHAETCRPVDRRGVTLATQLKHCTASISSAEAVATECCGWWQHVPCRGRNQFKRSARYRQDITAKGGDLRWVYRGQSCPAQVKDSHL